MEKIQLNNGMEIPQIGLGLWLTKDEKQCHNAVAWAVESGYRHFDSAQIYGNEQFLGDALQIEYKNGNVNREDLFITTKLWNDNQFFDDVIPSFEESLEKLQTDYVDLFLVHFPVTETRGPAWLKMEEIYKSGKAKSIGVSNYTVKHLEELLNKCEIKPAVNQVEIHVFLQQKELRDYCAENNIIIEAYSPLAHGNGLDDPVLIEIGKQYGKSSAQVMIRWCAQMGMVVLPKSVTQNRINENIDIYDFELSIEDLEKIASLEKDFRTCWDPTNVN
ncbi:MAG: aldo/keto reductase [Acidimicrobiia bacterium]